jgi:hypothetical protein
MDIGTRGPGMDKEELSSYLSKSRLIRPKHNQ